MGVVGFDKFKVILSVFKTGKIANYKVYEIKKGSSYTYTVSELSVGDSFFSRPTVSSNCISTKGKTCDTPSPFMLFESISNFFTIMTATTFLIPIHPDTPPLETFSKKVILLRGYILTPFFIYFNPAFQV